MGARRISIDPELLEWLYVEETLSIVAIAARLGCADNTVLRRLRRAGIEVRPRGPIPRRRAPRADQVETFRRCLRLEAPISQIPSAAGIHHKVQWCDRGLYDWFLDVGLTPAKSRTIGPLAIPDGLFADFFRGCLDSDGSVLVYTDAYHAARRPQYVYERLYVSLVSASRRFLDWIKASIGPWSELRERSIVAAPPTDRYGFFADAKAESIRLLAWMYYAPDVPCLARKRAKAVRFLAPLGCAPKRSVGRPRVGWLYTDTAEDTRIRAGVV